MQNEPYRQPTADDDWTTFAWMWAAVFFIGPLAIFAGLMVLELVAKLHR